MGARKAAIVALTPRTELAAEIGADHGLISAHLLWSGTCDRMVVSDCSAASLGKARRLFALHGLEERAVFRVADGLEAVREPVGAVLIAGMGARTMTDILRRGRDRIGDASLVLQANVEVAEIRRWLAENGFCLEREALAKEDGRFYVIMRARRGSAAPDARDLYLGPCLLAERPPLLREYLTWKLGCLQAVRRVDAEEKKRWVEEALQAL